MSELLEVAEVLMGSLKDRMGALESKLASTIVAANQGLEQKMSAQAKAFEGLATEQAKREERLNLRLSKLEGSLDRHESNQLQRRDLVSLESKLFENTKAFERTEQALSALTAKKTKSERDKSIAFLVGGILLGVVMWNLVPVKAPETDESRIGRAVMSKYEQAKPEDRESVVKLLGLTPADLEAFERLSKHNQDGNPPANLPVKPPAR